MASLRLSMETVHCDPCCDMTLYLRFIPIYHQFQLELKKKNLL